jgi:hypothetical protein
VSGVQNLTQRTLISSFRKRRAQMGTEFVCLSTFDCTDLGYTSLHQKSSSWDRMLRSLHRQWRIGDAANGIAAPAHRHRKSLQPHRDVILLNLLDVKTNFRFGPLPGGKSKFKVSKNFLIIEYLDTVFCPHFAHSLTLRRGLGFAIFSEWSLASPHTTRFKSTDGAARQCLPLARSKPQAPAQSEDKRL